MSLPASWVDRVFMKLTVAYGHRFLSQYSGIDMDLVKADWAEELGGFQQSPTAIQHALSILPSDNPPNVFQFRDLCRKAPQYAPKALPAPPVDPAMARVVKGALKPIQGRGDREWAQKLKARIDAGYRPTIFQRQCMEEALAMGESK